MPTQREKDIAIIKKIKSATVADAIKSTIPNATRMMGLFTHGTPKSKIILPVTRALIYSRDTLFKEDKNMYDIFMTAISSKTSDNKDVILTLIAGTYHRLLDNTYRRIILNPGDTIIKDVIANRTVPIIMNAILSNKAIFDAIWAYVKITGRLIVFIPNVESYGKASNAFKKYIWNNRAILKGIENISTVFVKITYVVDYCIDKSMGINVPFYISGTTQQKTFFREMVKTLKEYRERYIISPAQAERKRMEREKKMRVEAKKKLAKQAAEEKSRAKAALKREQEKKKNRKNNLFCKNDMEFFSREDIEDIPTKELTFIKLDDAIFCYDQMYFTGMLDFAKGQKVRGNCKPLVEDQPLECDEFVPINVGNNVFIPMKNYEEILKKHKKCRKFELKNKRIVDFTTGLHIMSQKSGKDVVYDMVPAKYAIKGMVADAKKESKSIKKENKEIEKAITSLKVRDIKKICKEKGIKGYEKLKKKALIDKCLDDKQKLRAYSVLKLKDLAKKKKIKGYTKMNKSQLIKALM